MWIAQVQHSDSSLNEGGDTSARAFAQRTFTQRVGHGLQIRDAIDHDTGEADVRRSQVQEALVGKAHTKRFEEIKVVNAEQFDALLRLGKKAALNFDALGGDLESGGQAA